MIGLALKRVARILEREDMYALWSARLKGLPDQDHHGCVWRTRPWRSPMNRADHGGPSLNRHRDLNGALSTCDPTSSQLVAREWKTGGRSVRQEPERARTGKGHAVAGGCVFRRNMGLFPFATRFARASQLAFVTSPPTNDLTPHPATLDQACTCPFLPVLYRSETTVLAWISRAIRNN